jgi:formate dehydrogenase major subunit
MTNEENYLASKLGHMALGTNHIFGTAPVAVGCAQSGISGSNTTFTDLLESDLILLLDGEVPVHYPIVAHKIKQAVGKSSNLLIISPMASKLDPLAEFTLKVSKKERLRLLQLWVSAVRNHSDPVKDLPEKTFEEFSELAKSFRVKSTKIRKFLNHYLEAQKPVIVVDGNNITSDELELLHQLALLTGKETQPAGIMTLYSQGNIQGQLDMGIKANTQEFSDLIAKIQKGSIKGLLIFSDGSDLDERLFQGSVKTVLVTPFLEKKIVSDIIIPGTVFVESSGNYTNCEGRIQEMTAGVSPLTGKDNLQVIAELSSVLGYPLDSNRSRLQNEILNQYLSSKNGGVM